MGNKLIVRFRKVLERNPSGDSKTKSITYASKGNSIYPPIKLEEHDSVVDNLGNFTRNASGSIRSSKVGTKNDGFLKSLCNELGTAEEGQLLVINVITKSLARIVKLQSFVVKKECRLNILKRGLDRGVILERNISVNCIITDLLSERFCDKDEVLRFQHFMYRNLMDLESKSIAKEMTFLNATIAKERRILKSITTDGVFKLCNDFLQKRRTDEMVTLGLGNEVIWKGAVLDKDEQTKSIDNWLKLIDAIPLDKHCGDMHVSNEFRKYSNISFSDTMIYSFVQNPTTPNDITDNLIGNHDVQPEEPTARENGNDKQRLPVPPIEDATSNRFSVSDEDIIGINLTMPCPSDDNPNEDSIQTSSFGISSRENSNLESNDQGVVNIGNFVRVDVPRSVENESRIEVNENRVEGHDHAIQAETVPPRLSTDANKENVPPSSGFDTFPSVPNRNLNRELNAKTNGHLSADKKNFNRFRERNRFNDTRGRQYNKRERFFPYDQRSFPRRYNQNYFDGNDPCQRYSNFYDGRKFR